MARTAEKRAMTLRRRARPHAGGNREARRATNSLVRTRSDYGYLVKARALDVENFSTQGQHRLKGAIASLLAGYSCTRDMWGPGCRCAHPGYYSYSCTRQSRRIS